MSIRCLRSAGLLRHNQLLRFSSNGQPVEMSHLCSLPAVPAAPAKCTGPSLCSGAPLRMTTGVELGDDPLKWHMRRSAGRLPQFDGSRDPDTVGEIVGRRREVKSIQLPILSHLFSVVYGLYYPHSFKFASSTATMTYRVVAPRTVRGWPERVTISTRAAPLICDPTPHHP